MRIGVLGVGATGQEHVRVYSAMRRVESVRVYDLNRAASREVAARTGAEACGSAAELFRHVDAVSICVPAHVRQIAAEAAIEHGVSFLLEKPACRTARQVLELAGAVPEGLTAGVGHVERFNPVVAEVEKIVDSPLYVEARRHAPPSPGGPGSVVEDLMLHDLDVVGHLFPGVVPRVSSCGTPEVCSALMVYAGVPVYLSASRRSSRTVRALYIEQEELTVEADYLSQEVTVYRRPGAYEAVDDRYVQENVIERVLVNRVEPLERELATFVDCAREGRPFPVTLEEAAAALEVCRRVSAGLASGGARTPAAAPQPGLARGC